MFLSTFSMDFQLPSFQILLSLSLFAFVALDVLKRSLKSTKSTSKLPPGPRKLPIVGNLHQLKGPLPHETLRDLAKKYGPLMHIRMGQVPTFVISSPETAKEVMRTHDAVFSSRPTILFSEVVLYNSTDMVFSPFEEYGRHVKKIVKQELMSAMRVESFRPIRDEVMSNLVEWISARVGSPINITDRIYWSTNILTARTTFGKKSKDPEKFISTVSHCTSIATGFDLADLFPSFSFLEPLVCGTKATLQDLHQKADLILDDIINEHKKEKPDAKNGESEDLVDVLLKSNNSDAEFPLTTENIKAIIFDIFYGGTETPASVLNWAMAEVVKNPRIMKKAQNEVREVFHRKGTVDESAISEMTYLKAVVKEALRLHPPFPLLFPRKCGEKCEINGYDIPVKSKVIVNAWAIGRDPKYWSEPETFIPERFLDNSIDFKGSNFEYIPFGAGRRICPAISLGLIHVELPLALLLYHFDWKLPNGLKPEDLDMTEAFGIIARKKDDLHLIPIAYDRSPIEKVTGKIM